MSTPAQPSTSGQEVEPSRVLYIGWGIRQLIFAPSSGPDKLMAGLTKSNDFVLELCAQRLTFSILTQASAAWTLRKANQRYVLSLLRTKRGLSISRGRWQGQRSTCMNALAMPRATGRLADISALHLQISSLSLGMSQM